MGNDQIAGDVTADGRGKRPRSLAETVYARLRAEIITCQLPPGLDLSEQDLADRFGVSKTPIREALGRLNQEGFVETFPRRGYRIRSVTLRDIGDLFELRSVLEQAAAGLAAQTMSGADLDRLDALANASYTVGETRSMADFIEANRTFHGAIAQASRNPRLAALVMTHLEESERLFYLGAQTRDVNIETNHDHSEIVAVLRSGDAEAAARIMAEHIQNTRHGLNASILASGTSEVLL
ncbi:GntR family transcriptional regulator [Phenylobacterium sp.]|uniref:GntR family transcriptional regulator n=1 Tax=Phenylobacterium sp. TaxID=1871053 RepID=UPI00263501EA|nr:GntR family transcriptional regulator [Phenylobacterium sp.]